LIRSIDSKSLAASIGDAAEVEGGACEGKRALLILLLGGRSAGADALTADQKSEGGENEDGADCVERTVRGVLF
jgi:hypothetical protein